MKGNKSKLKAQKTKLLTVGIVLSILFATGSGAVYRNGSFLERIKTGADDMSTMAQSEKSFSCLSGSFYRELAEKMQFFSHSPGVVSELYKGALLQSPADYKTLVAYASYLSSLNCCEKEVVHILQEAARRYPKNPQIYQSLASYLLTIGEKEKAIPYFHKTLELKPDLAETVYRDLDRNEFDMEALLAATPDSTDTMLELVRYLTSKGPGSKKTMESILKKLSRTDLAPRQSLILSDLALRHGWTDLARQQATTASHFEDTKAEAFRSLAEISRQERDLSQFEKYSAEAERTYLKQGDPVKAAESALSTVLVLAGHENSGKVKQRLLQIMEKYPRYAPAYYETARIYQNDSSQLALTYLKKASELDPGYQIQLAEMYLTHSQPEEAEKIYQRLLLVAGRQKDAYLGLAKCKQSLKNPYAAIAVLEEGLEKVGKSEELLFQLARLYDSVGDYRKAAHTYSECSQLNPSRIEAHNLAGDAYVKAGEHLNALQEFRQALQKDPQNSHALQSLSNLEASGH